MTRCTHVLTCNVGSVTLHACVYAGARTDVCTWARMCTRYSESVGMPRADRCQCSPGSVSGVIRGTLALLHTEVSRRSMVFSRLHLLNSSPKNCTRSRTTLGRWEQLVTAAVVVVVAVVVEVAVVVVAVVEAAAVDGGLVGGWGAIVPERPYPDILPPPPSLTAFNRRRCSRRWAWLREYCRPAAVVAPPRGRGWTGRRAVGSPSKLLLTPRHTPEYEDAWISDREPTPGGSRRVDDDDDGGGGGGGKGMRGAVTLNCWPRLPVTRFTLNMSAKRREACPGGWEDGLSGVGFAGLYPEFTSGGLLLVR